MKILSIIPARGGSKGLERKNIINLLGKPLITWTIEASLNSKYITKTIVSSDDKEILSISEKYGADTILRPLNLAQDTTPTEPVIEHVLFELDKRMEKYDLLVLLQPTSPLRNEKDIDDAIELLVESKGTALISVEEIDSKILKAFKKDSGGYLEGISNNSYPFMRRQDLPSVFMPNGAIYIINVKEFLVNNRLFTEKTIPYKMDSYKSFDIDTIEDLQKCEKMIKGYGNV